MFVIFLHSLELQRSLFTRGSAGLILFKGWGQSPLSAGERKVLIASKNLSNIVVNTIAWGCTVPSSGQNYYIEETTTAPKPQSQRSANVIICLSFVPIFSCIPARLDFIVQYLRQSHIQ